MSDTSEQTTLADLLWRVQGKAISHDSILHSITGFSQTQFGLAIEGFIKGQATMLAPMLASGDSPTVLLQTISNSPPGSTHRVSVTPELSATAPTPSVTTTQKIVPISTSPMTHPTAKPTATVHR